MKILLASGGYCQFMSMSASSSYNPDHARRSPGCTRMECMAYSRSTATLLSNQNFVYFLLIQASLVHDNKFEYIWALSAISADDIKNIRALWGALGGKELFLLCLNRSVPHQPFRFIIAALSGFGYYTMIIYLWPKLLITNIYSFTLIHCLLYNL